MGWQSWNGPNLNACREGINACAHMIAISEICETTPVNIFLLKYLVIKAVSEVNAKSSLEAAPPPCAPPPLCLSFLCVSVSLSRFLLTFFSALSCSFFLIPGAVSFTRRYFNICNICAQRVCWCYCCCRSAHGGAQSARRFPQRLPAGNDESGPEHGMLRRR